MIASILRPDSTLAIPQIVKDVPKLQLPSSKIKVTWLVEEGFHENSEAVVKFLERGGDEVIYGKHLQYKLNQRDIEKIKNPIMTLGSIGLCRHMNRLCRDPYIEPAVWFAEDNYNCSSYYPILHNYLLNSDYILLPLGDVMNRLEFIYHNFDSNGFIFIRPNRGTKVFTGQAIHIDQLEKFVCDLLSNVASEEIVLISSASVIQNEYRVFCSARGTICGSKYKEFGLIDYDSRIPIDVYEFAESVLEKTEWFPDPMFAMDICSLRPDNSLRVVEINSFCASGFYHTQLDILLTAARDWVNICQHEGYDSVMMKDVENANS